MAEHAGETPWSFVAAADIHVGSPRSYRYESSGRENWTTALAQMRALAPELLLLAGDLTRDGNIHRYEFEAVRRDLDALPCPWHAIAGNMDTGNKHTTRNGPARPGREDDVHLNVTSAQLAAFAEFFGPLWWTFVHRGVRFSGFPDVVCGSGLPQEAEFWRWLAATAALPPARAHVWMMHAPLFIHDPREPNYDIAKKDEYLPWYFGVDEPHRARLLAAFHASGATLVLSGHVHLRRHRTVEGIRFDHLPQGYNYAQFDDHWPTGDGTPGFMAYEVRGGAIAGRFVPLARVCAAPRRYGPGGHPPAAARDYTLAWERGAE